MLEDEAGRVRSLGLRIASPPVTIAARHAAAAIAQESQGRPGANSEVRSLPGGARTPRQCVAFGFTVQVHPEA